MFYKQGEMLGGNEFKQHLTTDWPLMSTPVQEVDTMTTPVTPT